MAEPLWMKLINMDVSLNQKPDGNNMMTMAGTGITKGCNMEVMDGLGAGMWGPPSSSSLESLSSSSLSSMLLSSAPANRRTASSFGAQRRKAMKEELERKETERKEMERKELERKEIVKEEMEGKELERKELMDGLTSCRVPLSLVKYPPNVTARHLSGRVRDMFLALDASADTKRKAMKMEVKRKETPVEAERKGFYGRKDFYGVPMKVLEEVTFLGVEPSSVYGEIGMNWVSTIEKICRNPECDEGRIFGGVEGCVKLIKTVVDIMVERDVKLTTQLSEVEGKNLFLEEKIRKLSSGLPLPGNRVSDVGQTDIGSKVLPSSAEEEFPPLPPLPQRSSVVQAPPPIVIRDLGVETGREAFEDELTQNGDGKSEWRLVGRRKWRDRPLPPLPGSGLDSVSGLCDAGVRTAPPPPRQQIKVRPRSPLSSAVMISGRAAGFSYAAALRSARERIDLETLGIKETCVRKSANGGILIEVSGDGSRVKAEKLGMRLREVLKDSATVTCPSKKCDLRVTGFDESVSSDEIARALSSSGGCPIEDLRIGPIRSFRNGLGMVWVQLPVAAATRLADVIRLGWMMAKVELFKTRPLQCFKCWNYGHVRNMCNSAVDRRDACFRCGKSGHMASNCQGAAHCALCQDAGLKAAHRLGGPLCRAPVQQSTLPGNRRSAREV